jgi:hypothetical protein
LNLTSQTFNSPDERLGRLGIASDKQEHLW